MAPSTNRNGKSASCAAKPKKKIKKKLNFKVAVKPSLLRLIGYVKMVNEGNIATYRERLDVTLASENLINESIVQTLVRDQIIRSSNSISGEYIDDITEKRASEVSSFLEMLRSASEKYKSHETHASWKLKQDTEELRVMYREGPVGSPYHTLLVDGYFEAPLDVCLCVSWETTLYPLWFPEMLIPTFKIVEAKILKKVRIGEQISLVRLKLFWPLSSREILLHYLEFEYLQGDLIVVLLNTIPDVGNVQMETHGFTNEGIPNADNAVRISIVGGYALQKVTENRTYFRLIGNLDIKLDFVPPAVINFISRQLIGSAFRLFQKTVASVCNGDEAFGKALEGPHYNRIRQADYLNNKLQKNLKKQNIQELVEVNNEKQKTNVLSVSKKEDMKVLGNGHVNKISEESNPVSSEIEEEKFKESNGDLKRLLQNKSASEIEEEEIKESVIGEVNNVEEAKESCSSSNQPESVCFHNNVPILPQAERAVGALDKMIPVVKELRLKSKVCSQSSPWIEGNEAKLLTTGKNAELIDEQGTSADEIDRTTTLAPKNGVDDSFWSENSCVHAPKGTSDGISPDQNSAITENSPVVASLTSKMTALLRTRRRLRSNKSGG